jgi:hypothetical protein
MLSKLLINSGPITYVGTWIVVIIILIFFNISYAIKTALLSYALVPIGSICQSILGYMLLYIGI